MVQHHKNHRRSYLRRTILVLLTAWPILVQSAPVEEVTVSVVSSDDLTLPTPTPRNHELTPDAVLSMVRRAVDLIGGMAAIVPDTARLVVIKPNISIPKPSGSGVVTDARVVRAVAILVHEVAPKARILIAEGAGGWMSPSLRESTSVWIASESIVDGFAVAGHRATVAELRGRGIDIDCYDLNFDRVYKLQPPGGGLALDEYEIAATIIDADVWINCPVAKTHEAKITCCLKNQFGILPGRVYGWNKGRGTQTHHGIPHNPRLLDELWVDLWTLSQVDLNVVDMITGTEEGAFEGTPRRSNLILAGRDPVATDLVVAKLMGFNPDDFEFADLAGQRGMGPGVYERVTIRGGRIDNLITHFKKAGVGHSGDWQEHANFGMGPRRWTLLGPLPNNHTFLDKEIAALTPVPGRGGWSPVIWFGHDKIDLDTHFDDPTNCVVYAFTHFTTPHADSVRFWLGSDEGLQVWIDGVLTYEYHGQRRHRLGQDRVPGFVDAGEHRLLIRAEQSWGRFDFSFNICEPIDDESYAGNRYPGVRYAVTPDAGDRLPARRVRAENTWDGWYNDRSESTMEPFDDIGASRSAPDSVVISGVRHPSGGDFLRVLSSVIDLHREDLDSVGLACLSTAPFSIAYQGLELMWGSENTPGLGRLLSWLGLRYTLRYGYQYREAIKSVKGWLANGWVPLVGYGADWCFATGYRDRGRTVELRIVLADTVVWTALTEDWWAFLPGGDWANRPVVVAEPGGTGLSKEALVDSMAGLALELALRGWVEYDTEPWGTRSAPAGLTAWDAWVIDWERFPWTPEWGRQTRPRDRLASMREWDLPNLIMGRRLAAAYFARAVERAHSEGRALRTTAEGYREVAEILQDLYERLPEKRDGPLTEADAKRLDEIEKARPLVRRARQAERKALSALTRYLDRPDLPPASEDPLRRKQSGKKLLTLRMGFANGVYDLTLGHGILQQKRLAGKEAKGVEYEIHKAIPEEEGWQVAVEVIQEGKGLYRVLQQPTAVNGWTTILRVDNERTFLGEGIEVVLWAIPKER